MLYPSLFFPATLVGILQYLQNIRFLIQSLALHHVIRNHPECPVLLQCALADMEKCTDARARQIALAAQRRLDVFLELVQFFSCVVDLADQRPEFLRVAMDCIFPVLAVFRFNEIFDQHPADRIGRVINLVADERVRKQAAVPVVLKRPFGNAEDQADLTAVESLPRLAIMNVPRQTGDLPGQGVQPLHDLLVGAGFDQ